MRVGSKSQNEVTISACYYSPSLVFIRTSHVRQIGLFLFFRIYSRFQNFIIVSWPYIQANCVTMQTQLINMVHYSALWDVVRTVSLDVQRRNTLVSRVSHPDRNYSITTLAQDPKLCNTDWHYSPQKNHSSLANTNASAFCTLCSERS